MPQTLTIPFYAFKLHLQDGDSVLAPLSDSNALHFKKSVSQLSKKYNEKFQQKLLNRGNYIKVLDELHDGEFTRSAITVSFPAAKDGLSFPSFELEFEYFAKTVNDVWWGVIPALSMEAIANDEEELVERLKDAAKVDFTAKKRLTHVQHIISALWFEAIELKKHDMTFNFYSPVELKDIKKEQKRKLLPKVAAQLEVKQQAAYGREDELAQMERVIASSFSKNILLVGASGTGKTALVWELARRRSKASHPNHIWETTASTLIKELTNESGWQDNLSSLVNEFKTNGDFLFIRNLAELFEVGQYEGNEVSMADYLRPYISRGEITVISECTAEERARIEVRNPNYLSFFQIIQLEEPKTGLDKIIKDKVENSAGTKQIVFEKGAIEEVILLHKRFSPYSGLPGKPIRFLESILLAKAPHIAQKSKKEITVDAEEEPLPDPVMISRKSVLQHFSDDSGLPLFMIDPEEPMDVGKIKETFNTNVYGQEMAVDTVVDLLAAVKTALTRSGKPIASLLFVGPTGVGKTELAKVVAQFMFGSRDRMIRFDMSEYSDPWSVMRLTGQGYFSDGMLTSAVRREPFCVLLFDEIEKADSSFYDLLLQIIGEGRLSDSKGKLVNFCSAIIIMTSNIGATKFQSNRIGWKKGVDVAEVSSHFIKEVEKNFKPEFYNRIDSVVPFEPLSKETVKRVVIREIDILRKREGIQFRKLDLEISPAVYDHLAEKGYETKYGARYLQRVIREELIVPMAYTLNHYEYDDQIMMKVVVENGEIEIMTTSDPMAFDTLMKQWDIQTLADQASNYRRKMVMMQEGALYMRMQSELDMMEMEKSNDETEFWNDLARSSLYTKLLYVKEKSENLKKRVYQLEIEVALAAMNQTPFSPEIEARLEKWETSFFDLMLELFSLIFPENSSCYLSIYGNSPLALFQFYFALLKRKGFEINQVQAIWHREGFWGVDDDNPQVGDEEKQPSHFIKRSIDAPFDMGQFAPPQKNDSLYGLEVHINGPACLLYLSHEPSLQLWQLPGKDELESFVVMVAEEQEATPLEIVRQQFYQNKKAGRTVHANELKDQQLGIQTQLKGKDLTSLIGEVLDEIFEREIESMVI